MRQNNEDKLIDLHTAIADELLSKVKSGGASSSDIANAIKFLKDNGINCDGTKSPQLTDITDNLPSVEELDEFYK